MDSYREKCESILGRFLLKLTNRLKEPLSIGLVASTLIKFVQHYKAPSVTN